MYSYNTIEGRYCQQSPVNFPNMLIYLMTVINIKIVQGFLFISMCTKNLFCDNLAHLLTTESVLHVVRVITTI